MKYTLLEIVQKVLSHINSDYCNSLEDSTVTEEALAVAEIVKDTYYHLLTTRDIKTKNSLVQLDVLSDTALPTYLRFQDDLIEMTYFAYQDEADDSKYKKIEYMSPEDFLEMSLALDPTADNIQECLDFSGYTLKVETDKQPRYWTSFDNTNIILDSYDKEVEATIQAHKVVAHGVYLPDFKMTDTFVPDLAPAHFPLLLSASKVAAGSALKRTVDGVELDRMRKSTAITDEIAKRTPDDTSANWFKNTNKNGKRTR